MRQRLLKIKNRETQKMCNLPAQIHGGSETKIIAKKVKTSRQDDIRIIISELTTCYSVEE